MDRDLGSIKGVASAFASTERMPMLFVGHGSPMNAIEANEFSRGWQATAKGLPTPNAILCISAHWETIGTRITAMERPPTIHDFYGFPQALFDVAYQAIGSPALAAEAITHVHGTTVSPDLNWGLDHGCWSILKHMYPKADVPVLQMSMDKRRTPEEHVLLAKELDWLRYKGVLIIGSGNIVHNLRLLNWQKPDAAFDWAAEANLHLKNRILEHDLKALAHYDLLGTEVRTAVPTAEHFLPMLYVLGLKQEQEPLQFFNDRIVMGSISMTSFQIG